MKKIDFNGQVAIVTGAGGGMGHDMALTLAARGAKVVVNDYGGDILGHAGSSAKADAVVKEIRAAGGTAIGSGAAVGTPEAAQAIVKTAMDAWGRVDVLINNAGVTAFGGLDEIPTEDVARVLGINFWGPYLLMREVWPIMKRQAYGRILNVSSSATFGMGTITPYSASKAGLIGLSTDAAIEGRPLGILVNALLPAGHTRLSGDELTAPEHAAWFKKYFQTTKIAQAVAYLVSRDMQHAGEVYDVGGGRVAKLGFFSADGYFDPELTPESVAAHFEQARDMRKGEFVSSCVESTLRYAKFNPREGAPVNILPNVVN
jgi:NAD(P)-dependent dehydrogenase (short-subunit alcohol dehydrogenase family)